MAETNSTPSTPSTQAEPQAEQPQPLLAYDPAHAEEGATVYPLQLIRLYCRLNKVKREETHD